MICAIVISDIKGNRIIYKNYSISIIKSNLDYVSKKLRAGDSPPSSRLGEYSYHTSAFETLKFTSICKHESFPLKIFSFHSKLRDLFVSLFDSLDEKAILDNIFSVIAVLDEAVIAGVPVTTHKGVISERIADTLRPNIMGMLRKSLTSMVMNELYIDHYELIDTVVDSTGTLLYSSVRGQIDVTSLLMEDTIVKIILDSNFVLPSSVVSRVKKLYKKMESDVKEIGAVRFHENVRLDKFGDTKTIDFKPPSGMSEFMSYRYEKKIGSLFSATAISEVSENLAKVVIQIKGNYSKKVVADYLKIIIPVSKNVTSIDSKATVGKTLFVPEKEILEWEITNFEGCKDVCLISKCKLSFPDDEEDMERVTREFKQPVKLEFEISNYTISGFQIKDIEIVSKTGQSPDPCLKYSTKSGKFEIKMS